jgi:hypothetical protein
MDMLKKFMSADILSASKLKSNLIIYLIFMQKIGGNDKRFIFLKQQEK